MKVLVFGASGSGKTFVSNALRANGVQVFDADEVAGLSSWYNREGHKVPAPSSAREAMSNGYAFMWSRKFLKHFLHEYPDVFLFGGAGNVFGVFDLFDKVYFLKVDPLLQKERLKSPLRNRPDMDRHGDEVVVWGAWLEEEAARRGIPFIDASMTPGEIFACMQR
ncbi:MAG: AAA family ATPase [Williamsia sp.]|nr:AAA family ATPase [Williamsia sp.]